MLKGERVQRNHQASLGPRSFSKQTLHTASVSAAVKISLFEQFIEKSIKKDLFNLTYHDDVFAGMLRNFIPMSDIFIKTEKNALSSIGVAEDGSVYAAPSKKESRKKRKSRKLEFLTSLIDSMIASILEFSEN